MINMYNTGKKENREMSSLNTNKWKKNQNNALFSLKYSKNPKIWS